MKTPLLSRRQFFKLASATSAFCLIPESVLAATRKPLIVPPLLSNERGRPVFLTISTAQATLSNSIINVWGFNGRYLGPTIKLQRGEFAKFSWQNQLPQSLAISLQGLQTEGELYGDLSRTLKPQQSWAPIVPITQPAGCLYYHACTWKNSAYQTYRGLAGLCIVEDPKLNVDLPNQYGVTDIPLILQDMQLSEKGEQIYQTDDYHFLGNRLFVNGQENSFFNALTGMIRLRLVNASVSRAYNLHFEDDRPFKLIARDQGFLPQAVTMKSLHLAPSQRAEILVDLSQGGNVKLLAGEKQDLFNRIKDLFDPRILTNHVVVELRTMGLASAFSSPKHYQFPTDAPSALNSSVQQTRHILIDTEKATMNGETFDPRRLDIRARKGTTERWIIQTTNPTTFCIRGAKFVVAKQGKNVQPAETTSWRDSVYVASTVELLVRFDERSSNQFPFFYGSADLPLADAGCLGSLVVE